MTEPRPRVAIIDDDAAVVRALTRLLKARGYCVQSFASSRQFLDADASSDPAAGGPFECLVVDVHMPCVSGIDLQEVLQGRGRTAPIIFVSGASDDGLRNRALAAGATAFLQKPMGAFELLSAIERALVR